MAADYGWTLEYILELTMRQAAALVGVIRKRKWTEYYNRLLSNGTPKDKDFPSLDSFLSSVLNDKTLEKPAFDEKTDRVLEQIALKRLEEGRKNHG